MAGITAFDLHKLLTYDSDSGDFRWRVSRGGKKAGSLAGCIAPNGYRYIRVMNTMYLASRLAWLYTTGEWPKDEIDHKNVDQADDRFSNLREANRSQNNNNTRMKRNNKSGYKGVCWDSRREKWLAQIMVNRKHRFLGYFETPEEAYAVYCDVSIKERGEFLRLS